MDWPLARAVLPVLPPHDAAHTATLPIQAPVSEPFVLAWFAVRHFAHRSTPRLLVLPGPFNGQSYGGNDRQK